MDEGGVGVSGPDVPQGPDAGGLAVQPVDGDGRDAEAVQDPAQRLAVLHLAPLEAIVVGIDAVNQVFGGLFDRRLFVGAPALRAAGRKGGRGAQQ